MISVQSITKEFFPQPNTLFLLKSFLFAKKEAHPFQALTSVSFEIKKGEVVGIIGRNGAGKSTLLQLICGTIKPTKGTITVDGKIGALLELGAGFHPEFTGIENIYLSGATMGLKKKQLDLALNNIVDFADIHEFVEKPVKTYSSGMMMRLAFSIATCVGPEVLVIDEVLSVGDQQFAHKCLNRILELKDKGTTILFCSHSTYQIEALCDRAIWLDQGQIKRIGKTKEVTMAYNEMQITENPYTNHPHPIVNKEKGSVPRVHLRKIEFFKNEEFVTKEAVFKSRVDDFRIKAFFNPALRKPTLALSIRKPNGEIIASAGSLNDKALPFSLNEEEHCFEIVFKKIPLLMGNYSMDLSLFCEHGLQTLDSVTRIFHLKVIQDDLEQGIAHLHHKWETLPKS